ncbi:hypothetical protein ACN6KF_001517 [Labrys sp. La1]|uniref:hypothetical protein n=1 Tax=Labrys sp. La1 TaxID=3404917 RepID=UPI003EBE15BF
MWPSSSGEWAAWVQAVGSIIALLVALSIAWWQSRVEERRRIRESNERAVEKAVKAYALRCLLLPPLTSWQGDIYAASDQQIVPTFPPETVQRYLSDLGLLGEAGFRLSSVVGEVIAFHAEKPTLMDAIGYSQEIDAWAAYIEGKAPGFLEQEYDAILKLLKAMNPPDVPK